MQIEIGGGPGCQHDSKQRVPLLCLKIKVLFGAIASIDVCMQPFLFSASSSSLQSKAKQKHREFGSLIVVLYA